MSRAPTSECSCLVLGRVSLHLVSLEDPWTTRPSVGAGKRKGYDLRCPSALFYAKGLHIFVQYYLLTSVWIEV